MNGWMHGWMDGWMKINMCMHIYTPSLPHTHSLTRPDACQEEAAARLAQCGVVAVGGGGLLEQQQGREGRGDLGDVLFCCCGV